MLYQAISYAWDEVGNGRSHSYIDGLEGGVGQFVT
jgi:hypothetical protein